MSRSPIVTKRRLTRTRRRRQFRARVETVVRAHVHDRLFNDDTFIADRVLPVVGEPAPHDPNDPRWAPVPGEHPAKARIRAMMRGDAS